MSHLLASQLILVPKIAIPRTPRVTKAQTPIVTISLIPDSEKPKLKESDIFSPLGQLLQLLLPTRRLFRLCRIGGLNVLGAWPFLALKLDKLYAALISC